MEEETQRPHTIRRAQGKAGWAIELARGLSAPLPTPTRQGGDIVALFFLSAKETARLREAEHARQNRAEIIQAWSQGQITRRELVKWGLITAGGLLVPIHGLSPFARSAYASTDIPTGAPPSPLFGV